MNRKTLILIISSLLLSIIVVIVLYLASDNLIHSRNSFIRLFPPHPVVLSKIADIKYNSYYIAGATSSHIYLGNVTAPLNLLIMDYALADTLPVQLRIENLEELKLKTANVAIDSPYFYITDGIRPAILRGTLENFYAREYMPDSIFFTASVPISSTSFAIRSFNSLLHQYILAKETKDPPYFKPVPGLLEKQVDGLFCTDGMLHYNRELARLVYVYYYRNQFICMDTNLNLQYRGKTIDTISHAQIKVADIATNNSVTLSAPPLIVNKKSCVSGNWLFVNSGLLAKNEDAEVFDMAAVIDVYNLKDGTYKFSFYLFDHGRKKMQNFRVFNNTLVALHDHYVLTYNLEPRYFQDQ